MKPGNQPSDWDCSLSVLSYFCPPDRKTSPLKPSGREPCVPLSPLPSPWCRERMHLIGKSAGSQEPLVQVLCWAKQPAASGCSLSALSWEPALWPRVLPGTPRLSSRDSPPAAQAVSDGEQSSRQMELEDYLVLVPGGSLRSNITLGAPDICISLRILCISN